MTVIKRCVALLTLLILLPTTPAFARSAPATTRAVSPRPVSLPADAAAHDVPIEWWYFVGHLADNAGHTYGFETTFFKTSGLRKYGSLVNTAYREDVAITDEDAHRFYSSITYTLALPPNIGNTGLPTTVASTTTLRLRAGTIAVTGLGHNTYHIQGTPGAWGVNLVAASTRPPMLVHGGFLGWGSGYTYYYSLTHMRATGTLTIAGRAIPVHGVVWHDHQWGDMGGTSVKGWDWMALQLNDGADISLVNERPSSFQWSRWAQALLPDNTQRYVRNDVFITPLAYWRSSRSGVRYPSGWRVRVPALQLDVTVRPTIPNQEMLDTAGLDGYHQSYWEGSCTVTGTRAGHAVSGKAYTELTGYGASAGSP